MTPLKVLWIQFMRNSPKRSPKLFTLWPKYQHWMDVAGWTLSCRRGPGRLMVDVWQGTNQHFTLNMNKASCILDFVTRSTTLDMGGIGIFPGMRMSEFKTLSGLFVFKTQLKLNQKRYSGSVLIIHCTLHFITPGLNSFFIVRWNFKKHHFCYFCVCDVRYFSMSHGFIISLGYNLPKLQLLLQHDVQI